jgi:hypothetical protein
MIVKGRTAAHDQRLVDIAREELVFTASAFFAPVVGAVYVVSKLLKDKDPAAPQDREAA